MNEWRRSGDQGTSGLITVVSVYGKERNKGLKCKGQEEDGM